MLGRTVDRLVERFPYPAQIIISPDRPTELTLHVARALQFRHSPVELLPEKELEGKGAAVLRGLSLASGDVVGFFDADGPFKVSELASLASLVGSGEADCAIASKWLGRSYLEVKSYSMLSKKILGRGLNLLTRAAFGLKMADTQGGAKLLSRAAWDGIDKDFTCLGFDFDVELLWKLQLNGARIQEVAMSCRERSRSRLYLPDLGRILLNLARLRVDGTS